MAWGFHIVLKTVGYQEFVGRIPFAEQKFGAGGTNFFLKLIGVGVAIIGILIATNIISEILEGFANIFV